jgi:hypothetical protein
MKMYPLILLLIASLVQNHRQSLTKPARLSFQVYMALGNAFNRDDQVMYKYCAILDD